MPVLSPVPALQVSVFSSGTTKGIAQTRGAQVVGRGELIFGHLYIAAYVKNVTAPTWDGEAAGAIGVRTKLKGFNVAASAMLRQALDAKPGTDSTALEFAGSVSRRFGPVTPILAVIYTPNEPGTSKRSMFLEVGSSYAITKQLSASAALGRRQRVRALDYTAWNAGLTWTPAKRVSFDARYWDTNRGSQWPYKARFVVSGSARF